MPVCHAPVVMLPYRDDNNKEIRYAALPVASPAVQSPYDSDGEPLISPFQPTTTPFEDNDALLRFTATGRPMQAYKHSNLQGMVAGDSMYSVPQHLPKQYTDDSIIPAIIIGVTPRKTEDGQAASPKKKGLLRRVISGEPKAKSGQKGITKVVYMPRREYLRHFARGLQGEYIGSEPQKEWTEEELEEKYKEYQPAPRVKGKGYRAPF